MDKNKCPKSTFQKNFPTNFFTFYIINQISYLKNPKYIYIQYYYMTKFIVFDTETTGFSFSKSEIVQLSYILYDTEKRQVLHATTLGDDIVQIKSPKIPKEVSDIHGITIEDTHNKQPIKNTLTILYIGVIKPTYLLDITLVLILDIFPHKLTN